AGLGRCVGGAVGGIVVVNVDAGPRQRRTEIGHDLADGRFLIVARHQHRNPAAAHDFGGVHISFARQHRGSHRAVDSGGDRHIYGTRTCSCIIAFLSSCVPLRLNPEIPTWPSSSHSARPTPPSIAWWSSSHPTCSGSTPRS